MNPGESIHLLTIDIHDAPEAIRAAIKISHGEQLDWLNRAAAESKSLVVLLRKDALEFYTTEADRRVTLRPILEMLTERIRTLPEIGKLRTIQRKGTGVARHLLSYAVECAPTPSSTSGITSELHCATALSLACSSMDRTLASLFQAAKTVVCRVREETSLADTFVERSWHDLDSLVAERIVEEELATWQYQEAEALAELDSDQVPPSSVPGSRPFAAREHSSEVRLRVAQSISPRISFMPERNRSAS